MLNTEKPTKQRFEFQTNRVAKHEDASCRGLRMVVSVSKSVASRVRESTSTFEKRPYHTRLSLLLGLFHVLEK